MTLKVSVLKPGYLVSLKTSLKGGVSYQRKDLIADHTERDGTRIAQWETRREIADAEEFERATVARGKARFAISGVCCASTHGLLCPLTKADELEQAIKDSRAITRAFNESASNTQIEVCVIVARIADSDVEAARAIGSELRDLMEDMKSGIAAADPAAIREAANKARALGAMLSPEVAGSVSAAIVEARTAARAITARVGKAGESAADVVKELTTAKIDSARFSFLDLDDAAEVETESPGARAVEFEP
jgi:hypothetical protein